MEISTRNYGLGSVKTVSTERLLEMELEMTRKAGWNLRCY